MPGKDVLEKELAVAIATESTSSDDKLYDGIVFSITDGSNPESPIEKRLTTTTASEWFETYPEDVEAPSIKLLAHRISSDAVQSGFDIPFSKKIVDEAIWDSHVYTDWSRMQSGACAALTENPIRFVVQTPNDGFPFVSLAIARRGHICKGIYTYDHAAFDPIQMMPGERLYSGWRSDGMQIVGIPSAILRVHSAWLASEITRTLQRLRDVEQALASPYVQDFFTLQRTLHLCSDMVMNLERRSEFESLIIAAIEVVAAKSRWAEKGEWPALAPAKLRSSSDEQSWPCCPDG
ncbi:hypothetical protein AMS68_006856 [Peltaster fructicola]|uniref:Uncharacterized protein n=1 Tax=Peltaster fructicola TaxID=286661 RepID=A0A6H0Y3A3_9PEZI|nr:hypothetical protein AMS68_006856 [Peltaster fructicola]